jgi:predicted amidohydrolase YtcJ
MNKVIYNAQIHTLDKDHPRVSALAIQNGAILAVGDDESILAEFGSFPKMDLEGKIVLPGLTDAHIHLQHYSMGMQKVNCETRSRAECIQNLADRVGYTPAGDWVEGHGWNQNNWGEGFGSAALLDEIAPENPVYLTAKSLHAAWVNSAALKLAGITATTPDPVNGRIVREENGEASGILLEDAMYLVGRLIPEPTQKTLVERLKQAQTELWKMGLTGIHDFDQQACFSALQILHERGQLRLRVLKSISPEAFPHAISVGLRSGFGDDFLRIGSLKLFADGALGPHTAAMLEPFVDEFKNYGILNLDKEQIFEFGSRAVDNGFSLAVHAIGDRANHEVLDGFHQLRAYEKMNNYPHLRHRIEHVQLLHSMDTSKLAELDLIASMQPIHAPSDMKMADLAWGQRNSFSYAWRTQLEHGARLVFGSDAPVESPNPFWGLHAAVTRQQADGSPGNSGWHPEQRLTIEEALLGFTQGPAYAAGMEGKLGKLKAGYLADLIVLEHSPLECHPSELIDTKPVATMVDGDWVWQQ